jgi:hypothetical protein
VLNGTLISSYFFSVLKGTFDRLDWMLLGPLPTLQKCIFKKNRYGFFFRYRPIVLLFWSIPTKLTNFSRLFTYFMQSFDPQWFKMCQKIISMHPPLWAKIWIFLLIFFFLQKSKFLLFFIKFLHFTTVLPRNQLSWVVIEF